MSIFFHYKTSFKLKNSKSLKQWLIAVARVHYRDIETVNYIFCDDNYLLTINTSYLGHDDYTDIITFDYQKHPQPILADIFISVERIQDNANDQQVDFETELLRVMVHGILHIVGYKDKSLEEKVQMRAEEDKAISMYTGFYK